MVLIRLVPISPGELDLTVLASAPNLETVRDMVVGVGEAQQALYARTGATAPWIGYFAIDRITGDILGSCSFVGPPDEDSVEIAYFTFPASEGKGVASAMASELVSIARADGLTPKVHAFTLPVENPSTRIMQRLGFQRAGTSLDEEAGEIGRWELGI